MASATSSIVVNPQPSINTKVYGFNQILCDKCTWQWNYCLLFDLEAALTPRMEEEEKSHVLDPENLRRRARDGDNFSRALKKETWSDIGVERHLWALVKKCCGRRVKTGALELLNSHQKYFAAVLENYGGCCDASLTRGLPAESNHTLTDQIRRKIGPWATQGQKNTVLC
ncbi:hypothetical protein TNCV_2330081 [Trichonephila clavipes]|nr:hypothetical protein TNCV_2330081 [Trichonephila clavipes]